MSAISKFDFQKENSYIFQKKLSKLYKKDTILYVTITYSLKQGETRTSSGPISLPLMEYGKLEFYFSPNL